MSTVRKEDRDEIVRKLLEQTRLREDQVAAHLENALLPAYWESLNPYLSLKKTSSNSNFEVDTIDPNYSKSILKKFSHEGYFQTEPLFSPLVVSQMVECMEVLTRADWPPVFAFVYDEFWEISRGTWLSATLSAVLGAEYKQIPHIWSHYVKASRGIGWGPHVDSGKRTNRLTVWIALSDATLQNGCIYLVPKDLAPVGIALNFPKLEKLSIEDAKILLQNTRALPVLAGSILCWQHDVIHWGARGSGSTQPRISISQEFIAEGEKPGSDDLPLLDAHSLPTFKQRLFVIAKALVSYQRFEPLTLRYLELGKRLLEQTA